MVGIILGGGGGGGADVSNVTATAGTVLAPKVFVDSNGDEIAGTVNTYSGDANLVPDGSDHAFSDIYIPPGGLTVKAITLQTKTVDSGPASNVVPDAGKYLSKVIVRGASTLITTPTVINNYTLELNPENKTFNKLLGVDVYVIRNNASISANMMIAASCFNGPGLFASLNLDSISAYSTYSKLFFCDSFTEYTDPNTVPLTFSSITSGGNVRITSDSNSLINKFSNSYTYVARLYKV